MKLLEYLLMNPVQVVRAVALVVRIARRLIRRKKEKLPNSGSSSV